MTEKEKLFELCQKFLAEKGLNDVVHNKRLAAEMMEIDGLNETEYFLSLYEKNKKAKFNRNNLLTPYLLGIVDHFDVNKPPVYVYGDSADVDSDFSSSELRDYVKDIWAPKHFGSDKVCNIASYNTFGIRSSLQEMAKVLSKSRHEIQELTKEIEDKDDDGEAMTWDKAMEFYPALSKYCEDNPDVAEAAHKMLHRNVSMGKHAGGLIVSSVPIDQFVPLVVDKNRLPCSAWTEGLHGQALGPVGLVKFDLLVVNNLMQIAVAGKFIKERHGLKSICALPGRKDWSDTSYLNDPKALAMANKGDLKCIFQFGSDGIRRLAVDVGIDSFEDLVAVTALYRPSALMAGMHKHYVNRKHGREDYEIPELLKPVLGSTYDVMLYQEQVMKILNLVGGIPLKDCELVRKAISKKKVESFAEYQEMFIINGQKNLGYTKEQVQDLWNNILKWAGYGFNKSHSVAYTYISSRLLYLKAHYPIEFYAAIMYCEDKVEKIREQKLEANKYGIKVIPVNINKSGVRFGIIKEGNEEVICYGLQGIKGLGEDVCKLIVKNQPYKDFPDFLKRCTTDAGVIKPLLGVRAFGNAPVKLFKYYQWYIDTCNKRRDAIKRFEKASKDRLEKLKSTLPEQWRDLSNFDPDTLPKIIERIENNTDEQIKNHLFARYDAENELIDGLKLIKHLFAVNERSVNNYAEKQSELHSVPDPTKFDEDKWPVDPDFERILSSVELSEQAYYGFLWVHPLEKSPDYCGDMTFESSRNSDVNLAHPLECRIKEAEQKESKKGTKYWLLTVEDANSEVGYVQVWSDDWERWEPELTVGKDEIKLVRIRVKLPTGGFRRYTLDSFPRHKKHLCPKRKIDDHRVCVLRNI